MIKLHIILLSMALGGMGVGGKMALQENFMTHSLSCNYDSLFTSQNPYSISNFHYTRCTVTTCLS